jgi:hypothetical protein
MWTDGKSEVWEESEKRKNQKKRDPGARKGRNVAKHFVFPMFCGSGGSKKVGSLKGCGARVKALHARITFGS